MYKRPFVVRLVRHSKARIRPHQVMVFNIIGNFGHYQVRIGGEDDITHTRDLEITGDVHHLFLTRDGVSAQPTPQEVEKNLKGTIVMREIHIHIADPRGAGDIFAAKETLNLAGEDGKHILKTYQSSGRLADETYKIVQEDILKALHKL